MKIGSVVYATNQGLGILAKSFFDNGLIDRVCIIAHGSRTNHPEWYGDKGRMIHSLRSEESKIYLKELCADVDVMIFFETPFDWDLISFCKDVHTKTILFPMYECMPKNLPQTPDLILNPSALDQKYYPQGIEIRIPVDVPWRQREKAITFVHNAGHGGLKGRNGTRELLEALWLCNCLKGASGNAEFIIRSQEKLPKVGPKGDLAGRIKWEIGGTNYEELWRDGDVFVFPEKFNGLSLPLQEARASGMLVMAGDRFPMNQWLPSNMYYKNENNDPNGMKNLVPLLIPPIAYKKTNISPRCHWFDEAVYDPKIIARTIDGMYGQDITDYSKSGKVWAENMSWGKWKPIYQSLFQYLHNDDMKGFNHEHLQNLLREC